MNAKHSFCNLTPIKSCLRTRNTYPVTYERCTDFLEWNSVSLNTLFGNSYSGITYMKLKMIALAAVMVASGAANATLVDLGATASTGYNGSVVFSVWDSAGSYSLNLSPSIATASGTGADGINSIVADVTAATGSSVVFNADAALTAFLGAAATAGLAVQWDVNALGAVATSVTNKELLTTANVTTLPTAPSNSLTKTAAGDLTTIYTGLNNNGISITSNEATINSTTTAGYANTFGTSLTNLAFSDAANLGQSQMLALVGYKTTGTASSTYTNTGLTASVDTLGNLTVAAVPEADTYSMLLAGLGAIGAIVRRRRNA